MFHLKLKYYDADTGVTGTECSDVKTWAEVLEIAGHLEIGAYNYFEVRDGQFRQIGYIDIPCAI